MRHEMVFLSTPSPPLNLPSPPEPGARENRFRITGYRRSRISGSVSLPPQTSQDMENNKTPQLNMLENMVRE
jgi:hypothetical protein